MAIIAPTYKPVNDWNVHVAKSKVTLNLCVIGEDQRVQFAEID